MVIETTSEYRTMADEVAVVETSLEQMNQQEGKQPDFLHLSKSIALDSSRKQGSMLTLSTQDETLDDGTASVALETNSVVSMNSSVISELSNVSQKQQGRSKEAQDRVKGKEPTHSSPATSFPEAPFI